MTEIIAESAPAARAGDPVGPELRRRCGARPADRRDARRADDDVGRGAWRRRSARRRSGPITRPMCAASRSAARPRTCWRSPPASSPGAGWAPARSAALTTRGFAELVRFGHALGRPAGNADGPVRTGRSDPDLLVAAVAQFFASAWRSERAAPRSAWHGQDWPKARFTAPVLLEMARDQDVDMPIVGGGCGDAVERADERRRSHRKRC